MKFSDEDFTGRAHPLESDFKSNRNSNQMLPEHIQISSDTETGRSKTCQSPDIFFDYETFPTVNGNHVSHGNGIGFHTSLEYQAIDYENQKCKEKQATYE